MHLEEVVSEPDQRAADGRAEDRQSGDRVERDDEKRRDRREHDQQPAHGRRALLGHVVLRAFFANLLADALSTEPLDELGPDRDRDDHRDETGD